MLLIRRLGFGSEGHGWNLPARVITAETLNPKSRERERE